MKKSLFSALLLIVGLASYGQKRPLIEVSEVRLERVGPNVRATLTLTDRKDGRNSYQTIARPVLQNGERRVEMPVVVFRTVKGRILDFRHRVEYPSSAIVAQSGESVVHTYSFPYKTWMNDGQLLVEVQSEGCGKVRPRTSVWVAQNLHLPPTPAYQIIPSYAYQQPNLVVVTQHDQGSAFLEFEVGSARLVVDYHRNPVELAKINRTIEAVLSHPDNRTLQGVELWGTCSPEGSYALNARLAQGRVEALKDYLVRAYPRLSGRITTRSTPENWAGLVAALADNTAPWAAQVTAIAQSNVPDNQKDRQIKALNNGTTYAYLLAHVYPSLRRVDYRVNYLVRQETIDDTHQVNQATAALQAGKWDEVLPLLDRVEEKNEYYYNTLGLYLLLNGQYDQARVALERAASMGLTEAQANVQQLALKWHNHQLVAAEQ